ncbi:phospholipase/Carboxylesterase [Allomuricauda ruestringensis DSM 13258]|uniref:Phospholipase/Carboxylesterase n=1 Tax=Allomuricauda ruestringensis (strain DSM 13258 / CIP 107369 / LMG 19739 / B1) TaxID=886377 RepID=G2PKL1_ALLRU|nr:alpha/beta fold hydrolase [Allomuricauda ruestringensis]AEM72057.1 phospholipase/Carboxylesterase [Allomuricauda ruestringensis DSM 13258]
MSSKPLSLTYLLRPSSKASGKVPALFMFHGYGSNEEDLFSFASELPEELMVFSVKAPYDLEPFGHAWYAINFDAEQGKWSDDEQAKESREKIVAFMDEAIEAYDLDKDNITLLGFSQGTILSYAVALSYPEKVKNVIALSGYINENILVNGYAEKDHSKLNVYTSHGQVDQVIPLEWAQNSPEFLENLGIPTTYQEFPVGHGVSQHNFFSFKKWLEEHV